MIPTTIRKLASEIAKREGKRSQARIGDIMEILGIIADMVYENGQAILAILYKLGASRHKKHRDSGLNH